MADKYLGANLVEKIKESVEEKIPTIHNEYGDDATGTLSQEFISKKLNSTGLILGGGNTPPDQDETQSGSENIVVGNSNNLQYSLSDLAVGFGNKLGFDDSRQSLVNVVVGHFNKVAGFSNVVLGYSNGMMMQDAAHNYCVAIGTTAYLEGDHAVVIGSGLAGEDCVAIGNGTNANGYKGGVALGSYSKTTRDFEVNIACGYGNTRADGGRVLGGVSTGELDTDAVNKKQMEDYVAANAGGGWELVGSKRTDSIGAKLTGKTLIMFVAQVTSNIDNNNMYGSGKLTATAVLPLSTFKATPTCHVNLFTTEQKTVNNEITVYNYLLDFTCTKSGTTFSMTSTTKSTTTILTSSGFTAGTAGQLEVTGIYVM